MTHNRRGNIVELAAFGKNDLLHSELIEFENGMSESAVFGIKYVVTGKERYIFNDKVHEVNDGQYLLVNKGRSFQCSFKSDRPVEGFCIGLDEAMLAGVYQAISLKDETLLDNPFTSPDTFNGFHEIVYSSGNELGLFIRELVTQQKNQIVPASSGYDLFADISVRVLYAHTQTTNRLSKLQARRTSTKKELLARLEQARQLLDDCTDQCLSVPAVARKAALSEFHFYRSFKAVYGLSPHQYLIRKKLSKSVELMKNRDLPITEVAYRAGFNDIYSFSKAFRQHFGASPTQWKNNQ